MTTRPTLETARLVLRPFDPSDAKDVQRLAGDKAIADTTLEIPHPYGDGMAEEWISTHQAKFDSGEALTLAVTLRDTGELVGSVSLKDISTLHSRAELGYWTGKPFWNRGYCTEAACAVIEYGFAVMGLNRIFAHYMKRNPGSGRVMEKLGMKREGTLRRHVVKRGVHEDMVFHGILKSEWRGA